MFTSELFQNVLINPVNSGCDELLIASGYASSAMAFHHLNFLREIGFNEIKIKLIIGMSYAEGISLSNHNGFKQIMNIDFQNKFECSYRNINPPFHTKLYIWLNNGNPVNSFLGSANYSQIAFNERRQKEALTNCNPTSAIAYFNELINGSIYCTHPDADSTIQIYNDRFIARRTRRTIEIETSDISALTYTENLAYVKVSLLDRNGNMHNKAGLNWGQRNRREPNEAYLQLSPSVYNSNFFPIRSVHFTVLTDDNKTLICTRAQKNNFGTAIETPQKNSLIGEYFRNRLGLANGAFVTKEDLIRYGRTDVTFYKIDDENFYMDFSV